MTIKKYKAVITTSLIRKEDMVIFADNEKQAVEIAEAAYNDKKLDMIRIEKIEVSEVKNGNDVKNGNR